MLGKRTRPPMNRTTSMKELTLDLSSNKADEGSGYSKPLDPHNPFLCGSHKQPTIKVGLDQQRFSAAAVASSSSSSPAAVSRRTGGRRHSADFLLESSSAFLKACSLCKLHLIPGRDIYMYRGDSAFCSLECRQLQINQDERKEKCPLASRKKIVNKVTGPEIQPTGETVAAAV